MMSDLLKMLKDVHLSNLITKEECQHLIKNINMKLKNKENLNGLDYEGFSKFLIQLCLNRYAVRKKYKKGKSKNKRGKIKFNEDF